jgi:hypothetical protein
MDIKSQSHKKPHLPTIERHIRNLDEAIAYLMGTAAHSVMEMENPSVWAEFATESGSNIAKGKYAFEKIKAMTESYQKVKSCDEITVTARTIR